VKPNVGLSTPAVFKALDYDLLSQQDPEKLLEEFVSKGVQEASGYVNDLEPPALKCVPLLATLKEELEQEEGFQHVLMSGSGTTIFCIGEPSHKQQFEEKFASRSDLQVFFSEFINRDKDKWFERPTRLMRKE
jgi:4-diphosphocytidyl-2-C-methyl-D-erythritol kinase